MKMVIYFLVLHFYPFQGLIPNSYYFSSLFWFLRTCKGRILHVSRATSFLRIRRALVSL